MRPIKRYEETAAILAAANRIYPAGWEVVESDTGRYKACNGLTAWNSLPYSETAATAAAIAAAVAALLATTITNGDTTHAPDGNSVFDALAGKLDTSAIASSITNGDTTHAPDGNSVFDALALKLDAAKLLRSYLESQATYSNDDSLGDTALSVTVEAAGVYAIDLVVHAECPVSGLKADFGGTATITGMYGHWFAYVSPIDILTPTGLDALEVTAAPGEFASTKLDAATSAFYSFKGYVVIGVAGTFLLRGAQNAVDAAATRIKAGSTLILTKMN